MRPTVKDWFPWSEVLIHLLLFAIVVFVVNGTTDPVLKWGMLFAGGCWAIQLVMAIIKARRGDDLGPTLVQWLMGQFRKDR